MTVNYGKLGPGTLSFGEVGTALDASCQATGVTLTADVNQDDDVTTLCGDVASGATTYKWKLTGTFLQDLANPDGIVAFSWENKGKIVPFTFTPSTADVASVTGECVMNPLDIGHDTAGENMTSDFEFACVGEPVPTFGTGATSTAKADAPRDLVA